jgi:hypothetical protein
MAVWFRGYCIPTSPRQFITATNHCRSKMTKRKRRLTPGQKAAKRRRREEFMTVFVNGKMKRVKRPPTVDGMPLDEFIARNADPIWLHQNEMWEYIQHDDE